jgi:multidrug efflux system membrane fusion protein
MNTRKQFLAGSIAGGLLILSGCGHGQHEVEAAGTFPVQTAAIEQVAVDTSTHYSATVEPDTTVEMAFKVDGYVDSLLKVGGRNLQEGDHVAKGAVLARVRQSDYRAGLDAAQARTLQADEGLKAAIWQLSQVEAIHKKAVLDAERAVALYEEKALTKTDYDGAIAQRDSTRAQVEAARKNVEAHRELLSSARAQERSSTITFEDTALLAPMAAVILEKRVELGTLVGRGAPAFRLGDLSTVRMSLGVPDTVVTGLKLGAALPVQVDAFPEKAFQGRIREIAAAADLSTRLYRIEVAIPNKAQQLKAGMMGKVSIRGNQQPVKLPAVPASALLRSPSDPNAAAVFVVERGSKESLARLRTIRLGQFVGSRATVLAGLKEGERVVTGGRQNLVDGAAIRVVE